MISKRTPRLLIGAAGSGCGKTTFVCGLLQALFDAGRNPVSFKCGPDYIDPMFHTEVLGVPSRNLDLFFTEEETVRYLMAKHADKCDMAVVEGVMGYYDGLAGISDRASSFHLAEATETPTVLLVDGRGKSLSLLAEIKGFLDFRKNSGISGIILNRISGMIYPELKQLMEEQLPVTVYGYLPKLEECSLESRHLGLVTAQEIKDLQSIIQRLADQIKKTVDLQGLMDLADRAKPLTFEKIQLPKPLSEPVSIGVAKDRAFCFYYQDNLELLEELGAKLIPFSPVEDDSLPQGISGLIFGGGYPELYLPRLSGNRSMRNQIRQAVEGGMPCLAECGGFMYLHRQLLDRKGNPYPMVGLIDGESYPTEKLGRFGYVTLTARKDNLLCDKGGQLKGHEFHYWDSTQSGDGFYAKKPLRNRAWNCVVAEDNLFAGYPHIYFYSDPQAARRFVQACDKYSSGQR